MRLLLDTHALIWLNAEPQRVPDGVMEALAGADIAYASAISAWEYGLKRQKRPDLLPKPFDELVANLAEPLAFEFACHAFAETLPPLHSDPFDRMLIAQAIHHGLTLVSNDKMIRRYDVETLW